MHVAQGPTHSLRGQSHALRQTATDTGDYTLPSLPAYRSHFPTLKRAERVAQASALGSPRAAMPAGDRW